MEVSVYAGGVGLVHLDDRQELLTGHQHLVLVVDDARQIHAPGGSRKNITYMSLFLIELLISQIA